MMGGRWKNFEVQARKSLSYLEGIVDRDMDVTGDPGEGSEKRTGEKASVREFMCLRDQNIGGRMNITGDSGEISA